MMTVEHYFMPGRELEQVRAQDTLLNVQFYRTAVPDFEKITLRKQAVYTEAIFVKITPAGETVPFSYYDNLATDEHVERFPRQWAQFLAGEAQTAAGTSLKGVKFITAVQEAELQHIGISTLEQIAEATDSLLARITDGADLKVKAKAFLEQSDAAELAAQVIKLKAELEQLKNG
jgi:predicted flap endonuclease-1-like 5' DNA nuclease